MCKQIYEIPQDFELISISKCNKLYLLSSNCIYEWNIVTEKSVRIFADDEDYKVINALLIKVILRNIVTNLLFVNSLKKKISKFQAMKILFV
jgi:hypothetical protein